MKGGGSRLNVNTDKPHSLISIKNKVLPTSPPANHRRPRPRQLGPGGRESGSREPLAAPRRLPPAARPPPPARRRRCRAERPAGHLAPRPRHALREPALRASRSPRAGAALHPRRSARCPRLPESPLLPGTRRVCGVTPDLLLSSLWTGPGGHGGSASCPPEPERSNAP